MKRDAVDDALANSWPDEIGRALRSTELARERVPAATLDRVSLWSFYFFVDPPSPAMRANPCAPALTPSLNLLQKKPRMDLQPVLVSYSSYGRLTLARLKRRYGRDSSGNGSRSHTATSTTGSSSSSTLCSRCYCRTRRPAGLSGVEV
jgi:hypothetical protein